jgi:hypothetical protein
MNSFEKFSSVLEPVPGAVGTGAAVDGMASPRRGRLPVAS